MFYLFQVSPSGFFIKRVRQKQGKCLIALVTKYPWSARTIIFSNGVSTSPPHIPSCNIFADRFGQPFHIAEKQDKHCIFLGFLPLRVNRRFADDPFNFIKSTTIPIALTLSSCSYCLLSNPIFRMQTALSAARGKNWQVSQQRFSLTHARIQRVR